MTPRTDKAAWRENNSAVSECVTAAFARQLESELDAMSNSYHAANKERLELKDKLANERTISDCLAGAISGTFDYGDAVKRYNESLESPRSGIPPVNIFTHGLGFQMHAEIVKLRTEINCRIEHGADSSGHLEYVQSAFDKMKNVPDSYRLICEVAGKSQPE